MSADAENKTDTAPRSASQPPKKKKRRLLKAFGVLVVLFILFVFYAQTRHAFSNLWLPIASGFIDGDLSVESGAVKLSGRAEMKGIRFADSQGMIRASVESFSARAAPLSVLGSLPRVVSVEVVRPSVEITIRDGESPAVKPKSPDEPTPTLSEILERLPFPKKLVPAAVERVSVRSASARVRRNDSVEIEVADANLEIASIEPGKTGTVKMDGAFKLAPGDPARERSGSTELAIDLTQSAGGDSAQWTGGGVKRFSVAAGAEAGEPMEFKTSIDGSWSSGGRLQNTMVVEATGAGGATGRFESAVTWAHLNPGNQIDAIFSGEAIGKEFLNPIVAVFSQAQFAGARIDGKTTVKLAGEEATLDSTWTAVDVSLIAAPGEPATPPIAASIAQAGKMDLKANRVTLSENDVDVRQGEKQLATVALDEEVTIDLNAMSGGAAAGGGLSDVKPRLTIAVTDVGLEDLRPWATAFGAAEALETIQSARVGGQLQAEIENNGAIARLTGSMALSDLVVKPNAETDAIGPIRIENAIAASLTDFARVRIDPTRATVALDGKPIASAEVEGDYDLESGAAKVALTSSSDGLQAVLDKLKLPLPEWLGRPEPGAMTSRIDIARADDRSPIVVTGAADVKNSRVIANDKTLERSVAVAWSVEADAELTKVGVKEATIALSDAAGANVGRIAASGAWPIPSPDRPAGEGVFDVTVAALDAAPYVNHFGFLPGRELASAVYASTLHLTQDAGGTIAVEGEHTLGPVRMVSGEDAPEEVLVKLETQMQMLGEKIGGVVIDIAAERPSARDVIYLEGEGELGDRMTIDLRGVIESLDAEWYVDMALGGESVEAAAAATPGPTLGERIGGGISRAVDAIRGRDDPAAPTAPAPAPGGGPPPLNVDAELEIRRLVWRKVELTEGLARLNMTGDVVVASLESARMGGGTLRGGGELGFVGEDRPLRWTFEATDVQVAPLIDSLHPWLVGQLAGTASFTTRGAGRGVGKALLDSLDGRVGYEVADGRFGSIPILNRIADETKVDGFRNMEFSQFKGGFTVQQGRAFLDNVSAMSPTAQLLASGSVGLDGSLDLAIAPRVEQEIASRLTDNRYAQMLLSSPDGFMTFPLAVTAKGTTLDPKYGVDVQTGAVVENLTGAAGDALRNLIDAGRGLIGRPTPTPAATPPPGATPTPPPGETPTPGQRVEDSLRGLLNTGRGILGRPTATPAPTPAPTATPTPTPTPAPR
jgi:hypothetical protein